MRVLPTHGNDGRNDPSPSAGAESFVYDDAGVKAALLKYQSLSADVPTGYDLDALVGTLPAGIPRKLAFFTYGDISSRAVAVALLDITPRKLFVDRDRDQRFAASEEVSGGAIGPWTVDLDTEIVLGTNQYAHDPRRTAPRGGEATDNRCMQYYLSLAVVSPADAVRVLTDPEANLPSQSSLLGFSVTRISEFDPPYARRLVRLVTDQATRCYRFVDLARGELDPDVRTDLISEALIAARQLGGDDYLFCMASVAELLWELGSAGDAQDVLCEAWNRAPDLQDILDKGERKTMGRGSDFFARTMALIDPDKALRLLELIVSPSEPVYLKYRQTEALLLVADSDPQAFQRIIGQFGYAQLTPDRVTWFLAWRGIHDVPAITAVVRQLPDSVDKAVALVKLARRARALGHDSAGELCREGLAVLYHLDLSHAEENAYFHYSTRAAGLVGDVALVAPDLVPAYLFASMWLWSGQHGAGNDFVLISEIASAMARHDPDLGRTVAVHGFRAVCRQKWSW